MAVEPKVFEHVRAVLNGFDDKYLNNGKLKRNKIIEDLDAYDEQLMTALLSDPLIHQTYTKKLAGVEIFEVNQFIQMLEFKEYWEDSYTKYSNKIGLTAGGKFIDESEDVVLDFPFKDTVLKAGMSKEDLDKGETADEPFLNEVIAKPEIDELLEPKVFVNAKRYDADGEHEADTFTDTDNLIIKGNNLIALHSLKKRYAGKVKLIYLDPPYNTGNDSFAYNDSFAHSSWLTFMKSRIEIARELLREDGSLYLNISLDEAFYLKVLTDSIFDRNNFITAIAWQKIHSTKNDSRYFSDNQDYILVYAKNAELLTVNDLPRTEEMNARYKNPDNDPRGPWQSGDLVAQGERTNGHYKVVNPDTGSSFDVKPGKHWVYSEINLKKLIKNGEIYFGKDGTAFPRKKRYLKNVNRGLRPSTIWLSAEVGHNQEGKRESIKLFGENAFATPKPERLLQRILTIGSNEGDLVLDFFMGSATTQAVAMKMNRRFIGIEQMDYIKTLSVSRLRKVIEGEQGGISKDVNWQGGGSFVYAELMEKNGGFVRDVEKAANITELLAVFNRMKNTADFDFRVDLDKFEIELNTFESLADQKRELLRILDKNQLYYNYANIDDANVRDLIADHDHKFNQSFYGNGGED